MTPVVFPQANITFAKDQSEYQPLPAYGRPSDPHGIERYCGDDWGKGFPETDDAYDRSDKVMTEIEDEARKLNIEVLAGVYEQTA